MSIKLRPELGRADPQNGLAYGVDPSRRELYSLRQARYHAIAYDIQRLAAKRTPASKLKILDIGCAAGITKCYLDAWPSVVNCELYGADLVLPKKFEHQDQWKQIWIGDLANGYSEIPSDAFDVVIAEQILEHLPDMAVPMKTLERTLRPGGTLFVGVPIFPPVLHLIRKHVVPVIDRLNPHSHQRGHLQAFSLRTFKEALRTHTKLEIVEERGFRILSGGPLRPLENLYGWWRFARWVGATVPSLCTEVQVIARKPMCA